MEGGSGMGLFDKKNCDICGEKIGILGNWIMVICARSVQENFHRGLRRGVTAL